MTRVELEAKHPHYEHFAKDWVFHIRSYFGGRLYKEGNYLLQHPFESAANFARRRDISYYYNYCGPIIDIFVSHLFRRDATRNYGSLSSDPLFEDFLSDADLDNSSFRHFMRDAGRLAAIYGRVSIIVDKPQSTVLTQAESRALGVRPYVALITPDNLLDWKYERDITGRNMLAMIKIREEKNVYRIWTRQGWELWQVDPETDETRLLEANGHDLGEVPVVNLYNRRSGINMIGISDIEDISDINKNIYYLCSDAKEIIENTAFPMLAMPYGKGETKDDVIAGPHNIMQFDPAEPNARPYWLEPPHSSLTEIREWVRQDIEEIYRIAKMGGVKTSADFSAAKSGVALELEYQQLYSILSEKADNIEVAESRILSLWARWEGKVFDGTIDYPDDFSVIDIDRDLQNAIKAQSARVASSTFSKELQKKIANATLTKIPDDIRVQIEQEIDNA